MTHFADAVAEGLDPAFDALARLADATVGARLFTLMVFDDTTREAERIYSNRPDDYPVSGRKPAPENAWADRVLRDRRIFVANTAEDVAAVFFDHELIASLGCAAALNLPVVADGRVLGTVNCLDAAGTYTAQRVAAADDLRLPAQAAFMLHRLGGLR